MFRINTSRIRVRPLRTPLYQGMIPKPLALLCLFFLSSLVCIASSSDQFNLDHAAWCAGLGGSTIDTLANFRLYAWNTDHPNDNSTGVPLVLATTGATAGAYSHTLVVSFQLGTPSLVYFRMDTYRLLDRLWNRMATTKWPISRLNKVASRPTLKLKYGQLP